MSTVAKFLVRQTEQELDDLPMKSLNLQRSRTGILWNIDYLDRSIPPEILAQLSAQRRDFPIWSRLASRYPERILEIGCGLGQVSGILAEEGNELVAIDPDPLAVRGTDRRMQTLGLEVESHCCSLDTFNSSQSFSLVVGPARVFDYAISFEEKLSFLCACHRLVHSSGLVALYVSTPPDEREPPEMAWRTSALSQHAHELIWTSRVNRASMSRQISVIERSFSDESMRSFRPLELGWTTRRQWFELLRGSGLVQVSLPSYLEPIDPWLGDGARLIICQRK